MSTLVDRDALARCLLVLSTQVPIRAVKFHIPRLAREQRLLRRKVGRCVRRAVAAVQPERRCLARADRGKVGCAGR